MQFKKLAKLKTGDKVAILSPSYAAPGKWPHVYQLGLQRLKDVFGLVPVEFPSTGKLNASAEERAQDLIAAFEDKEIYKQKQREIILKVVRAYNRKIPVVQNLDFGHTDP